MAHTGRLDGNPFCQRMGNRDARENDMSLSGRHLRQQRHALERIDAARDGWAVWRRRFAWVAALSGLSLWLQHRLAGRAPTVALGSWLIAFFAMAVAALVEACLARAGHRRQQILERTERAIGWGAGPYRLPPRTTED